MAGPTLNNARSNAENDGNQSNGNGSGDTVVSSTEKVNDLLQSVIQGLLELGIIVYDYDGDNSHQAIIERMQNMVGLFQSLESAGSNLPQKFPRDVLQYIEDGRNPDVYTREFVELLQRQNQWVSERLKATRQFRDTLAERIQTAFPELTEPVNQVVQRTSGQDVGVNGDIQNQ